MEPQPTREPAATATAHLQATADVTPELAYALAELILRAQAMFPDDPDRNRGE